MRIVTLQYANGRLTCRILFFVLNGRVIMCGNITIFAERI